MNSLGQVSHNEIEPGVLNSIFTNDLKRFFFSKNVHSLRSSLLKVLLMLNLVKKSSVSYSSVSSSAKVIKARLHIPFSYFCWTLCCLFHLLIVWIQIRPDILLGLIWIQSL